MLRYQWENAVRFWNSKKGEVRPRNCHLVKTLDASSFLTLHIGRKMDLL
ncbi:hypothetical protein F383_33223 [Gossypium arboreum]|uniref:Uncharacterized protein n=1 Tax=Gossypium arboreum TaxID=29729 RepID=A0A0B0N2P2_GOSAR|nr:hypothetical protein F383_33223 [Gossypium arboreum]